MITISLIRHAESYANKRGLLDGKLPGKSLSDCGKSQINPLALKIQESRLVYNRVYVSPFNRTRETYCLLNKTIDRKWHLTNHQISFGIKELDYGNLNGKKFSDYELSINEIWNNAKAGKYQERYGEIGESQEEYFSRIYSFLGKIIKRDNRTLMIITHECVCRAIIWIYNNLQKREKIENKINLADIKTLIFFPEDVDKFKKLILEFRSGTKKRV
ncbi:hypothetical protein A2982_00745 [candidate division WWE3 bacterium RIFCSPLOWO2_01_FULL_39_13]|uniref:Phosphoglycerate mutase n=1 Tax=candidate division WWE3 bacterium RIFCSPLOWO2_01_FULL_39_13 TaxID=1802624 RepID=A0A1F4V5C8_UNCKA|nr:MAG: hypothetical protein A2982_00745 [candidate division WWE3 bacterium RIFCSPLOWO2_01_FULL_39_13]